MLDNAASLLTRKATFDLLHEQSNKEQVSVLFPCLTHIYYLHTENLRNAFSNSENIPAMKSGRPRCSDMFQSHREDRLSSYFLMHLSSGPSLH